MFFDLLVDRRLTLVELAVALFQLSLLLPQPLA
jgi:hypothetical protein